MYPRVDGPRGCQARVDHCSDELSPRLRCLLYRTVHFQFDSRHAGWKAGDPIMRNQRHRFRLFGRPERPAVCRSLRPEHEMCGADRQAALQWLTELEVRTGQGG